MFIQFNSTTWPESDLALKKKTKKTNLDQMQAKTVRCGARVSTTHRPQNCLVWLVQMTHRLVPRQPSGVGAVRPARHPQHADALSGVVVVWGWGVPGRSDQRGGAGSTRHHIRAGGCRLHGNSSFALSFSAAALMNFGLSRTLLLFSIVSYGIFCCCQRSGRERSGCRKRGAGQAVLQGSHLLRM